MRRYLLIIASMLVISILAVSLAFAAVIFPPNWPSKDMPQDPPPIIIPQPFPPGPPIPPGPYPPPQPPPDGWTCTMQIMCSGWCNYDAGPVHRYVAVDSAYANTGCYANKEDALAAARELRDGVTDACEERLANMCFRSMSRFRVINHNSGITCSRCHLSQDIDPVTPE